MSKSRNFPKWINEYLKENETVILKIPKEFQIYKVSTINIKTASQLFKHIEREQAFWTSEVVKNNHLVKNYPNVLNAAMREFESALLPENEANKENHLSNAITNVSSCTINSGAELAKLFYKYNYEHAQFFKGFEIAITEAAYNIQNLRTDHVHYFKGLMVGLEYKKIIASLYSDVSEDEIARFNNAASEATEKLNDLAQKVDEDYEDFNQKHSVLFETSKNNYNSLEKLYQEHLKLSKPAEYWSKMEQDYNKKGFFWLRVTVVFSFIITIALMLIIFFAEPFNIDKLMEGIRTTAMITVIVTVLMLLVRFATKMTTSSFHLARDAKEREQLSYFYLALIKENAAPDNERHLIISSLFSRADTGLLKGDSLPEMPSNINIIDSINKSK